MTREDIEDLVSQINKSSYQKWTKYSYKVVIKKLYKVLEGNNDVYQDKVRWIKPRIKKSKRKVLNPEDMLTRDEVLKMINAEKA